jgi:lysophospholipase L1-like esterase
MKPSLFSRVVAGGLALGLALAAALPARAGDWQDELWVGSWGAGAAGPTQSSAQNFSNQTVRLIVHTSIGGTRVRIRLSNELGTAPLRIGAARIALRASGSATVVGSDRVLRFGGSPSITLAPGAPALSDPVELAVPAASDLAVSLYLPSATSSATFHSSASQTSYVSPAGDFSGAADFPVERPIQSWSFLTEVDVEAGDGGAIVTLGDSITDGFRGKRDTNNRWPDVLARRLQAAQGPDAGAARLGVVNRGISGNRLLANAREGTSYGPNILGRFDRDVLATAGVRYMTLLIGINDIAGSSDTEPLSADDLIAGYRQVIERAHAKGIAVFGATLTPFEGSRSYTPEREAMRQAVNDWIRTSKAFDGVIDFDRATRDPAHPTRLLPAYDSEDHLHPGDLGYQAMGNAVPLELFRPASAPLPKPKSNRTTPNTLPLRK